MKHHLRSALVLLLLLVASCGLHAQDAQWNTFSYTQEPSLSLACGQGLSGAFAGRVDGVVLVAGGCNFPGGDAAEGGAKVFYDEIYTLSDQGQWDVAGRLSVPVAYGQSVVVREGVLCLGGTSDGLHSLADVCLLHREADSIVATACLPLPVGLDKFGAALCDGYVYVAGGQHDGERNLQAWRLAWPHGTVWEPLPDLPNGRIEPAAVCQRGALGPNFYLLGGYDNYYNKAQSNGVWYDPRDDEWYGTDVMRRDSTLLTLVGSVAVPSGCAHILCVGGVDKQTFESALSRGASINDTLTSEDERVMLRQVQYEYMTQSAEWYRFRDRILVYHTITDTWTEVGGFPALARCGASVVSDGSGWLLIDGESKPGVRATDATRIGITYTAHFGWLNWTVLLVYLLGMLFLGWYFMRRASHSTDDFFRGGGRIPWWAAGISIFATMLSAITYMSIPAKAYATDWTYYPMQIMILLVAFPVVRYYLPYFRRLNVTTAYEYLEQRFNYTTRFMASLLFVVFMVARTALVLFLPSLAMTAVTGINIYICIALMALITIVYCTMGGVEAVVWGDVIQGIILVGGAILAALYLIIGTGENGASDFWQIATDDDKFRLFLFDPAHPFDWKNATWWVVLLGGLGNNLISYTSDQTVIQRYMTTKDEKSAGRGIITNGILSVCVTIAFFTIGTGLYTFYKTHPASLDLTMAKGDAIFPFFMMSQLPQGVAGLLIAAVFAATMSTIASNINSISTAYTVDIWKRHHHGTDAEALRTARRTGVEAGLLGMLIAMLMATVDIQSLLDYFNTILGLLSGGIGALFFIGIFMPHTGSRAALTGFVCGTLAVFYLNFFTSVNFLLFGFVSMAVAILVAAAMSLFPRYRI